MKIKAIDDEVYHLANGERTIKFGIEFIRVKRFVALYYGEPVFGDPMWLNVNYILTYWDDENEF